MRPAFFVLGIVAAALVAPAHAQPAERDVLGVVTRLFDGMRAGDTAAMRATLHPDARMSSATVKDGITTWKSETPDGWLASVARPRAAVLDERIRNPVISIDGALASVWVEYSFYLGDRFLHCGVDALHLVKGAGGWQIIALADTRRTEGCPGQPGPVGHSGFFPGYLTRMRHLPERQFALAIQFDTSVSRSLGRSQEAIVHALAGIVRAHLAR